MFELKEPLIVSIFKDLKSIQYLNLSEWDLLIRQAKRSKLTARLAFNIVDDELTGFVPEQAMRHLESAMIYCHSFERNLSLEIERLLNALSEKKIPLVLMKGAAYFAANNWASKGRIFSDIDILVREIDIDITEFSLMVAGWMPAKLDDYDQRYYRDWMHEIPPLTHVFRATTIDVHHNILPRTCKSCPDAKILLTHLVKIEEQGVWVLSPEDRLIHSAVHLFYEGELENGFRDIQDIDLLIREISTCDGFWTDLQNRTIELHQETPVYFALRYASKLLNTPISDQDIQSMLPEGIGFFQLSFMDFLYMRALLPDHASCSDHWTPIARLIIYIRSHWLKMPLHLLISHLTRKSWMRLIGKEHH